MYIIIDGLIQLFYSISIILVFGLFINAISTRSNTYIFHSLGMYGIVATGIIGTTIHELGHLIMAILFGHKIVGLKLFSLKPKDGVMGYVRHSFNKNSWYQNIGNFFIGIAPLFSGTIAMFLFMYLLIPESYTVIIEGLLTIDKSLSLATIIINSIMLVVKAILITGDWTSWQIYVYLILALNIAPHMSLSTSDIKGSSAGLIFIAIGFTIVNFALFVLGISTESINIMINSLNVLLTMFFSISIVLSFLFYIFSKTVYSMSR